MTSLETTIKKESPSENPSLEQEELRLLAERMGLTLAEDLSLFKFVHERREVIPYTFAKQRSLLPLDEEESGLLIVAIANPLNLEALEELRYLTGKEIREVVCSQEALEEAIERCYRQKENVASEAIASLQQTSSALSSSDTDSENDDLLEKQADSPLIRMLNAMLIEAIQQRASDIHFEPLENGIGVRYRIDGVLQKRHAPPREFQSQLITRIKVMSKLDIAEHRLPQDGRIRLKLGEKQIDFRVSTVPVVFGERIVLRILDKSNVLLGLNKLGMRPPILEGFEKQIRHSEGILLVTGPTGSGKTTTLYSALSEINSSEMNIMTIEDPVEYKLPGMAQIGVNPTIHLDFPRGLRHILRQDPDVIMVGEIRDKETADVAIQASLTGHLVFSTLHTNDAPSALTRLVEMGIEPYLLSSSVIGVLAQRLVRLICSHCKVGYEPSQRELEELRISWTHLKEEKLYRGEGCVHCFGSGYKGRHGIYELMPINTAIKRQIVRSADALELQKVAIASGMETLRQEGSYLVQEGLTTSREVLRATRSCEEG
jgi:general secretion pathway protein E